MEQVIFNLVLNARDAMCSGGMITIRTEEMTKAHAPQVAFVVADNGCGMNRETLSRVFDPFFSTKPQGKGTGLGLTTVHSIVTQCSGDVCVESTVGRGTTVTVTLPRAEVTSQLDGPSQVAADVPRGTETVLVVEDDAAVRESVREALSQCGYDVKVAADGPEALAIDHGLNRKPDLLIADLVLPGISGREVARRMRAASASLATLFISGYDQPEAVHEAENTVFLKPFSREALARKVRQVLDCEKPGSGGHGR
jgi:CheY-like chemotaxis protein/anti-sigma regulatory factor (Ser/Thr protein kinase)